MEPSTPGLDPAPPRLRGASWTAAAGMRTLAGRDDLLAALADESARIWVDMTDPTDAEVAAIAEILRLHPLIAEDIAEHNQRAKIAEIGDTIHIVTFWVTYTGEVSELEIDMVLGPRTLLTVHEAGWDPFAMPQLRAGPERLLQRGADFLLYALCDGIVDAYFPVMDAIEDEIDALQDDVIAKPTPATLERLFSLKRELIGLRRATSPAREIFNQLTNRDLALVAPENLVYFRDVYDHLIRVTDELDNDRDLVAGTLDVYLSTINNNLSVIMKRLTGVTVLLAGVGGLAGIFGMSESPAAFALTEGIGFWVVSGTIIALAGAAAWVLHRRDWI
jgi:magnesium transporter